MHLFATLHYGLSCGRNTTRRVDGTTRPQGTNDALFLDRALRTIQQLIDPGIRELASPDDFDIARHPVLVITKPCVKILDAILRQHDYAAAIGNDDVARRDHHP